MRHLSRLELAGWASALVVPLGMLACAALYVNGTLTVPRPMWSALDPLPLAIMLCGPVGLAVAILAHRSWPLVGRLLVGAVALPPYLVGEFAALIMLSGSMGEPF